MEFESLISTVTGGGLVLLLSQFVFTRLVHQVDRLADKIAKLEILCAKLSDRVEGFDGIETKVEDGNTRLTIIETKLARNH